MPFGKTFVTLLAVTQMIDHATIDRIMDAAQIYDVVSDFVTLRKRGVNYVGLCPFHDDKTPSFYVSPAKNLCKCFACGKGGNPVHFIMLRLFVIENIPPYNLLLYNLRNYKNSAPFLALRLGFLP